MSLSLMDQWEKATMAASLKKFEQKYNDFCNDHTCYACPLSPSPGRGIFGSSQAWTTACKAYVIDHLTEANKKMDEAIAKAEEIKRKREEHAEKLLLAIKVRKRDLEFHAMRDADYIILNPDDYALLKSNTTLCLAYCIPDGSDTSYTEIFGMRIVCDTSIKRGEFVIGFGFKGGCECKN